MNPLKFYRDESLFGLDIGHSSLKVMQLDTTTGKIPKVLGYGVAEYPSKAVKDGVIVDQKAIHDCLFKLLSQDLVGAIDTRRVVCTIPTARTFSRPMKLPPMERADLTEAVHLEAEQYIPIPIANLYIDYEISHEDTKGIDLLMVASPKDIVDSHIKFLEAVGLEPVALEPTMNAAARLFVVADPTHNQPSILIDFGSVAIDVAVFDQTMFVNSTIQGGSNSLTQRIAEHLNVSNTRAHELKNNNGIMLGDQHQQIREAVQPVLDNLVHEIQKIVRYYNDRQVQTHRKIAQIIVLGGGANMPGLSEFLTSELKLPARRLDPWHSINFSGLPELSELDRSMYVTVAGAATLSPKEIFT